MTKDPAKQPSAHPARRTQLRNRMRKNRITVSGRGRMLWRCPSHEWNAFQDQCYPSHKGVSLCSFWRRGECAITSRSEPRCAKFPLLWHRWEGPFTVSVVQTEPECKLQTQNKLNLSHFAQTSTDCAVFFFRTDLRKNNLAKWVRNHFAWLQRHRKALWLALEVWCWVLSPYNSDWRCLMLIFII